MSPRGLEPGLGHATEEPKRKGQDTKEGRLYRMYQHQVQFLQRDLERTEEEEERKKRKKKPQSFPEEERAACGSEGVSGLPRLAPPNFTLCACLSWTRGQFSREK